MNYLAHAFLSFSHPEILLGNMISDFIRGKQQFTFASSIRNGIELHRAIDLFTDEHEATHSLKSFFKPAYGRYSGAFADIAYDFFLANDAKSFENEHVLLAFTQETYQSLESNLALAPPVFQTMFPYMKTQNWLYNYRFPWGIEKSFEGLARRAKYLDQTADAVAVFKANREEFEAIYQRFFPELRQFAADKYSELIHRV